MRKGYWIIGVFAIWCVLCAIWYMFSVKGLPDNTGLIKPATTTVAIVEILIMITLAFFMGFGLAWMMRTDPMEEMTDQLRNSKYEIRDLESLINNQKDSLDRAEVNARLAEEKAALAKTTSEQLGIRLNDLTIGEDQYKRKVKDLETKLQQLDGEVTSTKFRIRVLESDLEEKATTLDKLTDELTEAGTQPNPDKPRGEHRDWSDHPFVRPVDADADERDDLTEIKGIGPAFQRKLYSLDIYSFRQISELSGEGVEHLADVIEVFPDRIHRDNWIGQATRLYLKKIGKES